MLTPSKQDQVSLQRSILIVLKDNGGQMSPPRKIIQAVEAIKPPTPADLEVYEATGNVKWVSKFYFSSIGLVKAGWIVKDKSGGWYLTPEGEAAIKLDDIEFNRQREAAYKQFIARRKLDHPEESSEVTEAEEESLAGEVQAVSLIDSARGDSREEIRRYIRTMNPYEFQDLVAALLRGLGYYTPFVAPKGPDGGVDIIAYKDPLGAMPPRLKVQVKQKPETQMSPSEIQSLCGVLSSDGDIGMAVSTGGFSRQALSVARNHKLHVATLDLDQFIELWIEHYTDLSEEDRQLMRLDPVWMLVG